MDIASPNSLWRDYDVSALPLNATPLSDGTKDGARVRNFYFDGFITVDGRTRAFLTIRENPDPKGTILYLADNNDKNSGDVEDFLFACGYNVATLDYTGKKDRPRYTLYPSSLAGCNKDGVTTYDAPDDALSCCWYVWACVARRAARLLAELYPLSKRFAVGKGLGGCTVYKLAAFDDGLSACATMLNILPEVNGDGNGMINYRAALDNVSYAPLLKTPLFMSVCSNAEDGSLDKMSELAVSSASLKCFRIIERAFSDSIHVVYDQIDRFFSAYIAGEPKFPAVRIKPSNSDNNLYFNITIGGENDDPHKDLRFYAAFCVTNPTNRNWTNIKTMGLGGEEYIAHVDVLQNDKPVYGFVNISDESGNIISSPLMTVKPSSLGIPAHQAVRRRLIYDGSMGADVWMSPGGGDVKTESGPLGIDGVTGTGNRLVTFKPGDYLYKADDDAALQIMVAGSFRSLQLCVNDGNERYTCQVTETGGDDDWTRYTLSPADFKSANGALSDWSDVMMFEFIADDTLLIGSVLWV